MLEVQQLTLKNQQQEHNRLLAEANLKNRQKSELEWQIEANKRAKDSKKNQENERDAALLREYDRMMAEREHHRNIVPSITSEKIQVHCRRRPNTERKTVFG
jgi:hypothetical protein